MQQTVTGRFSARYVDDGPGEIAAVELTNLGPGAVFDVRVRWGSLDEQRLVDARQPQLGELKTLFVGATGCQGWGPRPAVATIDVAFETALGERKIERLSLWVRR